jgi:YidC/Oxa1 family membrane protein insertase
MFEFIIVPFTNVLVLVYSFLGHNFGLAIIVFTLLVRLITYPFNAQQMKSAKAMQELQSNPKWKQIQEKYKGKENREKLAQEQMKLYQELGINPFGACLPTIIQLPLIIAMYWAITRALAATPLQLLSFVRGLSWVPNVSSLIPLNSHFLWMDLGQPERLYLGFIPFGIPVLAIVVMITSYFQTKMMTPANPNDQSAQMGKAMNLYMPILMAYISYIYSAGLALYFVTTNILGIAQYYFTRRPTAAAKAVVPAKPKQIN